MENRTFHRLLKVSAALLPTMVWGGLVLAQHLPLGAATQERMELVMGTLLHVRVEAASEKECREALEAGFQEARRWDDLLSNYKTGSEISRLNRDSYPQGAVAGAPVYAFLKESLDLARQTQGYFDPTVEPLTRLWRLRERTLERLPDDREVERARMKVGFQNVELRDSERVVRFLREGMGFDTGGVGKGCAMDRTLERMRAQGISGAVLNFGGEVLYFAGAPRSIPLTVRDPRDSGREGKAFALTLRAGSTAVSTSGNSERFVELKGTARRLGHLLNPKTGRPQEGPLESATVISKAAARADALSTAIFVMGWEEGLRFADRLPEDCAILTAKGKGSELQIRLSSGCRGVVQEEEKP